MESVCEPEAISMLQKIIARRAAQIRTLHDRGAFAGARVPLRNGGTLPAELFPKVALDDLNDLTGRARAGDYVSDVQWSRLAEAIELLHAVVLTPAGLRGGRLGRVGAR